MLSFIYAGTWGGGAVWTRLITNVSGHNIGRIAINPVSTSILYAGTLGSGVFKNTNGAQQSQSLDNDWGSDITFDR